MSSFWTNGFLREDSIIHIILFTFYFIFSHKQLTNHLSILILTLPAALTVHLEQRVQFFRVLYFLLVRSYDDDDDDESSISLCFFGTLSFCHPKVCIFRSK